MWMNVHLERLSAVSLHSVSTLLGVICASVSVALQEMETAALVSQISLSIQLIAPLSGLSFTRILGLFS